MLKLIPSARARKQLIVGFVSDSRVRAQWEFALELTKHGKFPRFGPKHQS